MKLTKIYYVYCNDVFKKTFYNKRDTKKYIEKEISNWNYSVKGYYEFTIVKKYILI